MESEKGAKNLEKMLAIRTIREEKKERIRKGGIVEWAYIIWKWV